MYFDIGGRWCVVHAWVVFENNSAFNSLIQKEEPCFLSWSFPRQNVVYVVYIIKTMDLMGL